MIRTDRLVPSRTHYAVGLETLRTHESPGSEGSTHYWVTVGAVWFRFRKGVVAACAGELRDLQDEKPADAVQFLRHRAADGFGGRCKARWDGSTLWCLADEEARAAYKAILVPMLASYPEVPAGWDGWWRF